MKNITKTNLEDSYKDIRGMEDKLLRELCSRDYHSKKTGNIPIFDIDEIYKKSFKGVQRKSFNKFLEWLEKESGYIQFHIENKISLTFLGRNACMISRIYG